MRNETIEKLRVFAIFIVVLGHSIIIYDPSWGLYKTDNTNQIFFYLKQFINIIQMPLFIMIAGFLFNRTCEKYDLKKIVIDKFKRIIIPFIFITLLWLVPIRMLAKYQPFLEIGYFESVKRVFLGIDSGHLWYLPTLFILFIITYIVQKVSKDKNILNMAFLSIFFILSIFANKFTHVLFLSNVCEYLLYFYIGFLVAKIQNKFEFNIFAVVIYVIFSILLVFFIKQGIIFRILNIFTAISGSYALYGIFMKIKTNKLVKIIDKNSFTIYLFHSPLIYIMYNNFTNINTYLLVTCNLLIAMIIPILIAYVLRKLKLNFIIGEKTK